MLSGSDATSRLHHMILIFSLLFRGSGGARHGHAARYG